ncbi:MAG: P63C domain-containing protein [Formosimonas sp.]
MKDDKKEVTGRAIGGKARSEKLTPEQRSEIARKGALAKHALHKPLEAIRKGNFKEDFGFDVECYVLNDEKKTAVMSQRGMATALGIKSTSGTALVSLVKTKAISNTSMGAELLEKLSNPLIFKGLSMGANMPPPRPANGFDVSLLIDICKAVIEATNQGALHETHKDVVIQANVILGATAKLGIQTLVYKLAGYDSTKEEVIAAFKAFVQDEAKKYEKEFPPELYLEWARLYEIVAPIRGKSWKNKHLTIDHVYYPLAKSNGKLLTLLRESKDSDGGKKKLFQFLNEVGTRALRMHLGRILEMAESSPDKKTYEAKIVARFGGQPELSLSEDEPYA